MTTLKKSLGEAGAAIDRSHGEDTLLDVLTALATGPDGSISVSQATPTTGVKGTFVITKATAGATLSLVGKVDDTGSANATLIQARVNAVVRASVSIDNAEADGTLKSASFEFTSAIPLVVGDVVDLNVSTVATSADTLEATVRLSPLVVEA